MFTGIVERTLRVAAVEDRGSQRRLVIAAPWSDVKHGESIALNGVCLTAAELSAGQIAFDVVVETLNKTNLGTLRPGDEVNVERSLRVGDRLDGHFVQGHVDGIGKLIELIAGDDWRMRVLVSDDLIKYIVPKGSVTLDGVSLTIAATENNWLEVALIPTTLEMTTLGSRKVGWPLNIETDMMAKTIVRFLELRGR